MANDSQRDPIEARVITVSREALRADLLDLELRLTNHISEALARKADLALLQAVDNRMVTIERDAIRRDGPQWRGIEKTIEDIKDTLDERADVIQEFRQLQRDFDRTQRFVKSDAELKQMMRDERTAHSGTVWTTAARIQMVITVIVLLAGFYLTWRYAGPNAAPAERSMVESVHVTNQ